VTRYILKCELDLKQNDLKKRKPKHKLNEGINNFKNIIKKDYSQKMI